jgi:hypothetical protein
LRFFFAVAERMRLLTIGKALPMGCRRIDGAKQYTDPARMSGIEL